MPKLPFALAATLFLLLSACGAGKPAFGLPSDPDALLKRVKVEIEEQRAFAVRDCANYGCGVAKLHPYLRRPYFGPS